MLLRAASPTSASLASTAHLACLRRRSPLSAALRPASRPSARAFSSAILAMASDKPQLELVYFGIAARAGPPRFIADIMGLPNFTDTRINFDQWQEMKKETPLGQLPMLKVKLPGSDEVFAMTQGDSITKYIAGLTGFPEGMDTPFEAARADEIRNILEDWNKGFGPSISEKDEDKKIAMRKELESGLLVTVLDTLESRLAFNAKENPGSPWFVGSKMTTADLKVFFNCKLWKEGKIDHMDTLSAIATRPHVAAFFAAMDADPKFSAHMASAYPSA